jgi:hypothetical protein
VAEIERLRGQFGRLETMEQRIEYTSRTLTELTPASAWRRRSIATIRPCDQVELYRPFRAPRAGGGRHQTITRSATAW